MLLAIMSLPCRISQTPDTEGIIQCETQANLSCIYKIWSFWTKLGG